MSDMQKAEQQASTLLHMVIHGQLQHVVIVSGPRAMAARCYQTFGVCCIGPGDISRVGLFSSRYKSNTAESTLPAFIRHSDAISSPKQRRRIAFTMVVDDGRLGCVTGLKSSCQQSEGQGGIRCVDTCKRRIPVPQDLTRFAFWAEDLVSLGASSLTELLAASLTQHVICQVAWASLVMCRAGCTCKYPSEHRAPGGSLDNHPDSRCNTRQDIYFSSLKSEP